MAFLKFTIMVAFASFVNAIPQLTKFNEDDGWERTSLVLSETNFLDGNRRLVAIMKFNVTTYNYTEESYQLISDTVRSNLASIQVDSEEPHERLAVYDGENARLPLAYNMTMCEVISSQQPPYARKTVGVIMQVEIWAKKQHRADVLGALKNLYL